MIQLQTAGTSASPGRQRGGQPVVPVDSGTGTQCRRRDGGITRAQRKNQVVVDGGLPAEIVTLELPEERRNPRRVRAYRNGPAQGHPPEQRQPGAQPAVQQPFIPDMLARSALEGGGVRPAEKI